MSDQMKWMELAPAYALGALDSDELRAFEAQLAQDPELQEEVRLQREVMGLLADGVLPRRAPDGLKQRIMSEVRSEAEDVRPIGTAPSAAPAPSRLPWVAAAASVILAVGFGAATLRLSERVESTRDLLAEAEASAEDALEMVEQRDELLASFLGPDIRTVSLAATGSEPSARLYWNGATGEVVVTAFGLEPAPEGRVYQLWGIGDGADPVSLGTFQTTADGTAVVRATAPTDAVFDISAVTQEPVGGSPQPTQTPFLVGSWAGD